MSHTLSVICDITQTSASAFVTLIRKQESKKKYLLKHGVNG